MSDPLSRVQSRIRQIEALLGEQTRPNEEFGSVLQRAVEERAPLRRASGSPAALSGKAEDARPLVEEAAAATDLPAELISAVISAESDWRPEAVSRVGARGLMQLMPGTAREMGVDDPFDPRQNVLGGSRYLRQQLDRFGTLEKALAAYNAGPGAVAKYGGVPPYAETRNYVRRVLDRLHRSTERKE